MLPHSMTTPDPESRDLAPNLSPDLSQLLERQIAAGFSPELAFDLVLHELLIRATSATHANAAALGLARGGEIVCRAATGLHAPDLGVPLNMQEGLSGACLRTREPQLCLDTESDPNVSAAVAGRLEIRSILIVPVVDGDDTLGIMEVFSSQPAAFSTEHQAILENFANECTRLHYALFEIRTRPPVLPQLPPRIPPALPEEARTSDLLPVVPYPEPVSRSARSYEGWTLFLGTTAVLAAIAMSFMIGSRAVAIRAALEQFFGGNPIAPASPQHSSNSSAGAAGHPRATTGKPSGSHGELVVYDHGKVVFRMKPAPKSSDPVVAAAENTRLSGPGVWLAPGQAARRLRNRVEPIYPAAALETHRSGEVILEILVSEDGSIASIRSISGDPALADAAADAVRNWRYEPYRINQRPTPFQTNVTMRFSLPDQRHP
jgi:TonB family protein